MLQENPGITYNTNVPTPTLVLDTNVLVAALRSRSGASFQIVSMIGLGRFRMVLSVPLVLEYEQALFAARPAGVSRREIEAFVDYLCAAGEYQEIFYLWRPALRDPKDDLVLEVAVAGECGIIVTHNVKDFTGATHFGIRILTPAQFLPRVKGAK